MILAKKFNYKLNTKGQIILGCLALVSAKLWNIANYEKKNYKDIGLENFPDCYEQKKNLKDNFLYKNLPSETTQEVLNKLQQGWQSFFCLIKSKAIDNPKSPRFKKKNSKNNFSYLNNGFVIIDTNTIKFSLSKQLRIYLANYKNKSNKEILIPLKGLSNPERISVTV